MSENASVPPPPPPEESMRRQESEIELIDLFAVLWRRKWLILTLPFVAGLGMIVFHVVAMRLPPERSPAPNVYTPQALALVHSYYDDSGAGTRPALWDMASSVGLGREDSVKQAQLAMRLARGDRFVDTIADEFEFSRRYGLEQQSAPRYAARQMIRKNLRLNHDDETGVIEIGYTDVDRELATKITNRVTELLDDRMADIGSARERIRMELIEQKLVEVEREVAELEDEIAVFQSRYGVLDVTSLAEEQLATIAELRGRLIATEVEIATYADFSRTDDPTMRRLRSERDNLRNLVREIQSGYEEFEGLMPTQEELPRIALEFERLKREARVREQLLTSMSEHYELARLAQGGTTPLFQVLEPAEVPELKSGPDRVTAVVVAVLVSGFAAMILAFVLEFIRRVRRDPRKMQKLRGTDA